VANVYVHAPEHPGVGPSYVPLDRRDSRPPLGPEDLGEITSVIAEGHQRPKYHSGGQLGLAQGASTSASSGPLHAVAADRIDARHLNFEPAQRCGRVGPRRRLVLAGLDVGGLTRPILSSGLPSSKDGGSRSTGCCHGIRCHGEGTGLCSADVRRASSREFSSSSIRRLAAEMVSPGEGGSKEEGRATMS
jgi:hypothetical protein